MAISRRAVLAGLGAAAASSAWWQRAAAAGPFNLSILTDEISQDFGHACEVASREFGMGFVDLREAGGKNIMNWDAAQIADVQKVLERFIAARRLPRDADLQGRLARRAEVAVQPDARRVRRQLHLRAAARAARARVRAGAHVQDRSDPHLRLLAARGSEAAPRGDRRGGARGGGEGGSARADARARERIRLQHRDRRRSGAAAHRHPGEGAADHLGSRQRAVPRRGAVPRRLRGDSRRSASATSTARTRCAAPTARNGSGWRWARASSTGPGSSAR